MKPTKRREARDSAEHPESVPVLVGLDVTGSMGAIPRALLDNLPQLLGAILRGGALADPQIAIAAVGDKGSDRVPLQMSQFEADNRIDDALDLVFIEGNGGGNSKESYDLLMYFAAHCVDADAWEKRGRKGYLFLIADEGHYDSVNRHWLADVTEGLVNLEANVPFEELVEALDEKWITWILRPSFGTGYAHDQSIIDSWKRYFPETVIPLDSAEETAALVAGIIARTEGVDVRTVLSAGGVASSSTDLVLAKVGGIAPATKTSALVAVDGDLGL